MRVKDLGDRSRSLPAGGSLLARCLDDLVVDVSEVHHLLHFPSPQLNRAAQQILEQERAEVAEVGRSVDRRPAGIDANRFAISGRKRFDLPSERIVEAEIRSSHSRKVGSTQSLRHSCCTLATRSDGPTLYDIDDARGDSIKLNGIGRGENDGDAAPGETSE